MKQKKNKFYRDGSFHHLYVKAINGNVIFYRLEDYILFYTLFSTLVKRYCIRTEAFCIMINHFHACILASSQDILKAFCRDLSSVFTLDYNDEYHLKGKLLMPCGYAAKSSGKQHRSCLIYIANNPSSGRMVKSAIMYRWNLLAYAQSKNPFSDKLVKRNCRFRMRCSLAIVDGSYRRGQYLNYKLLESIFQSLSPKERLQMIDYIIVKYYFLDVKSFISHFGSLDNALIAVDSSAGSENVFFEPWEDYSVYSSMLDATLKSGLDIKRFRFHEMSQGNLMHLRGMLSCIPGVTNKHLARFLHERDL